MKHLQQFFGFITFLFLSGSHSVHAEDGMGMMNSMCPMCGSMGPWGMALGIVFILAVIAALIALTVFLVRRSRDPQRSAHGQG